MLLAKHRLSQILVAVKTMKKEMLIQEDGVQCAMVEKRVMSMTDPRSCTFLVSLYSCFQTMDRLFFVMEYLPGGDLMGLLQKHGKLKEPEVVLVFSLLFSHRRASDVRSKPLTVPIFVILGWRLRGSQVSSDSEMLQLWFSAVQYQKIFEKRWFSSQQRWKRKFSEPKISAERRWFSLKQRWIRAEKRCCPLDINLVVQFFNGPKI